MGTIKAKYLKEDVHSFILVNLALILGIVSTTQLTCIHKLHSLSTVIKVISGDSRKSRTESSTKYREGTAESKFF